MKALRPFKEGAPFQIWAQLSKKDTILLLEFKWQGGLYFAPHRGIGERRVGLWEHTCFECFLKTDGDQYYEWNFSPKGDWNCFSFSKYREKNEPWEVGKTKPLEFTLKENHLEIVLEDISFLSYQLSAVIPHTSQEKPFYMALNHPETKPDFHDPRYFIDWSTP